MITSEKLIGSENYLSWSASMELWFMGQGYEDHLVTQEADILEAYKTCFKFWNQAKGLYTNDIQRLYKIDKFFMVLTLIGLRPDLETVCDQILGSSSVASLDDFLKLALEEDVVVTEVEANVLIAPIAISLATLVIGVISYMGGLPALPTWPNHLILSRLSLLVPPHLRVFPSLTVSMMTISAIRPPSQLSVAQTGNASACLTHTSSLGPWILDSGASDHISGNKDLFSSITTTSTLPTVTLANGSQTMAKGFCFAHPLPSFPLHMDRSTGKTIGIGYESQGFYHLIAPSTPTVCISTDASLLIHSRLGHPSLSKFQKMVPSFSIFVVACVDNARESFSTPFTSFMSQHGIIHQSSYAHTPQQNGVAERKNRHLVETARTLLLHSHVPFVFGGTLFLQHDKLSARATKCIFLGYSKLQKGYRCYSSETHRYFLSIDVTFFEDSSFFSTSESFPVSEVLPLPIISPPDAVPFRPLQVYHRRHRVAVPPSLAEVLVDSLPIPSASPALCHGLSRSLSSCGT
ncbi:hypothetical protein CK203_079831 [Vitis vinifera]|uniref:Integrase catalytic domain-containing protein n=1 Tax=Vitis vinifera TaxID=29760 RepID=A0A438DHT6_VITVI|nr:hypothetical protein CK203_079831 [Vitis vinifera]